MQNLYSISCYDKNLCLKPNITIWLSLLFLSRAYLILILSVANLRDKSGLIDMVYADRLAMSLDALAGIPAALLLYAWIKRTPGASRFVRKIWGKGRMLMAISALLGVGAIFVTAWLKTVHEVTPGDWVQVAIALLIIIVVYKSPYIRDCFNDFPDDKVPEAK